MKITMRRLSKKDGDSMRENALPKAKSQPGGASITSMMDGIFPVMTDGIGRRGEEIVSIPRRSRIQLIQGTDLPEDCIFAEDVIVRLHGGMPGRMVRGRPFILLEK